MIDLQHQIRTFQAADFPADEEPEHKPRWRGLFLAGIAGACSLVFSGCLMMAWRALGV